MIIKRKERRTYADRKEYIKAAVTKRRRILKAKSISLLGGACIICHYNKHQGVLEFHHVVQANKAFGIGEDGSSRSWVRIEAELQKCILVCANCHREIELGLHDAKIVKVLFEKQWAKN